MGFGNDYGFSDFLKKRDEIVNQAAQPKATQSAPAQPQQTSYQQNVAQPVQEPYTTRRAMAQMMNITNTDPQKGYQLQQQFNTLQNTRGSMYYNPFTQATNPAVATLQSYGIDTTQEGWYENNTHLQEYFKTTGNNNNAKSPGKKASDIEKLAYAYAKYGDAIDTTNKAKTESAALREELTFMANWQDRNYSDEEIINSVDWKKYPTLAKMIDSARDGEPIVLNEAVDMATDDWMYGVLWAARNDGGSGNIWKDMAYSYDGVGNGYEKNDDIVARRTFGSDSYAPFTLGSTANDICKYYGVPSFDREYLMSHMPDERDKTSRDMWNNAMSVVEWTEKAQEEAAAAQKYLKKKLENVKTQKDADRVLSSFTDYRDEYWPHLAKMDSDSKKFGWDELTLTSDKIDYSLNDVKKQIAEGLAANGFKTDSVYANEQNTGRVYTDQEKSVIAADDEAISDAGDIISKNGGEMEKNTFGNASSSVYDETQEGIRLASENDPAAMIKREEGQMVTNYVTDVTPVLDAIQTNEKAQEQLNTILPEYNALMERKTALEQYDGIDAERASNILNAVNAENWDIYRNRMENPQRAEQDDYQRELYEDAFVWLYQKATGDYGFEREYAIEEGKKYYDIIQNAGDVEPLSQEELIRLEELEKTKTNLEQTIADTSGAQAEYDKVLDAWDARIQAYEEMGMDTTELKTARFVAIALQFFADYEASEWNAYNAYDLMMQSEEGGKSFEEVKEAAQKGDAQIQEELENAKFMKQYIEDNNIQVPDNYMNNLNRHIAKLERQRTDYDYFVLQGEKDFEELAAKGKEMEKNLPIGSRINVEDENGYSLDQYMTENEKKTYYYLLAKNGADNLNDGYQEAMRYYGYIGDPRYGVLSTRTVEAYEEDARNMNPLLGNAMAILAAPLEGLLGLTYIATTKAMGWEFNPDSQMLALGKFSQTVNEETAKKIQEAIPEGPARDIAQGAYEILYNRGRSMTNAVLTGGLSIGGPLGAILTEIVGSMPMAVGAGAMAIADAKEKHADDATAMKIGGVTMLMESFTEGLTRSNIMEAFSGAKEMTADGIKALCVNWLKSSGVEEAFGETLTDYVEKWVDTNWLGEFSDHQAFVDNYIAENGLDPNNPVDVEEAELAAQQDELAGLLHTTIISYLSPGLDVATRTAAEGINDFHNIRVATRNMQKQGMNVSMSDVRKDYYASKQAAIEEANRAKAKQTEQEISQANAENAQAEQAQQGESAEQAQQEAAPVQEEQISAQPQVQSPNATQKQATPADLDFQQSLAALDSVTGADTSTQTAAIGVFFGGEAETAIRDAGNAAAVAIGNLFGGINNAVKAIKNITIGAHVGFVDLGNVKEALKNAALSVSSQASAVVNSEEFQNADIRTKAKMLADTLAQDQQNETVKAEAEKATREYRIAAFEKEIAKTGAYNPVRDAQRKANEAKHNLNMANESLEEKQAIREAKAQAVEQANQAVVENPTNDNLHELEKATNELNKADEVVQQYEQHQASITRANEAAQEEYQKAYEATTKQVHEQAEQMVAEQDQQRAEAEVQRQQQEAAIAEQQAQAQAEEDQRTGKKAEADTQKLAEDWANTMRLEGEEREAFVQRVQERQEQKSLGKIDMSGKVSNAEGYLAIHAFARKTGLNFQLSDTLPDGTRGMYENGTVYLNANLVRNGSMTIGQALVEAALHEVTHGMQQSKNYKTYRNVVLESMFGAKGTADDLYNSNAKYRAAVDQKIADYKKIGQNLSVQKAEQEIVADFARLKLADKETVQRFMDAGLGGRMRNTLHNINQSLKNFFGKMTGDERKQAEYLRRAERAYQKAMDEVAKTAVHPEESQFSVAQIAQSTGMRFDTDTLTLYDEYDNVIDGVVNKITPEQIENTPVGMLINSGLTGEQNTKAKEMMAGLMNLVAKYKDSNLVWEIGATTLSSTFSALKSNSDPQYKTTVDFGTVCAKTQAIIDVMSKVMLDRVKEGKSGGLSREDIMKVYNEVNKAGLSVPCPVCYVFSRWMGVPSLLGQMSQYQNDYVVKNEDGSINMEGTQKKADKYIKDAEEHYGDAKAINNAKTKMQNSLAKLEEQRIDLEGQLYDKTLTAEQKDKIRGKIKDVLREMTKLDKQIGEVSAYNWITQALCKKEGDKFVVDPKFKLTPDEILFDLNRTGEFAEYEKNWKYRNTRGAGMGKAIMPYSGETIGDILYGVKSSGRQNTIKNPWLNMDAKAAARQLKNAQDRAKKQNLVGGQRLQSTSDFRPEWGLDYIMSFLELQAAKSKVQMYTKVAEAVDFFASVGADVNLSIMGQGTGWHVDENGNKVLDFSSITGMDFNTAKTLKNKYDNVQMILVGMNDTHIRLALANSDIDFVIPWHSSGNSKDVLAGLIASVGEKLDSSVDYTTTQSDMVKGTVKKYKDENGKTVEYTVPGKQTEDEKKLWDARVKLLTKGGNALTQDERTILLSNPFTKELYRRFTEKGVDDECYNVKLTKDQAQQIFPYEYWDTSLTKDKADENGMRFVEYCESMGIVPRFSQFKNDTGYWKLLIDRPMYNNDGSYHQQSVIDVTNAKIGDLNEEGKLTGSDLPTQAQAKYAPKDPRNANYEKYTKAEQDAIDNAKAAIDAAAKYDDGTEGSYSVFGDMTDADIDQMLAQANEDYADAVARGDMEAAQEDVDFAAEQAGYTDKAYHGTDSFGFTVFDMDKGQDTIFVSYNKNTAGTYTRAGDVVRRVNESDKLDVDLSSMSSQEIADWMNNLDEKTKKMFERVGLGFQSASADDDGWINIEIDDERSTGFAKYDFIDELEKLNGGLYELYTKPGKQLVIECDGHSWSNIPWDLVVEADPDAQGEHPSMLGVKTRQIASWAKEHGYDSVRINGVYDDGGESYDYNQAYGDIGIFFNQNDVKSADPITYDNNGNVIPLDQRFKSGKDIRYSAGGELTDADIDQALAQMDRDYQDAVDRNNMKAAQRMVDDAAEQAGYTIRGYHGTSADFTVFDKSKSGQNWYGDSRYGPGIYFAHDRDTALKWTDGMRVVDSFIKMEKPLDLRGETPSDIVDAIRASAEQNLKEYDPSWPISYEQYSANVERRMNIALKDPGIFLSRLKYDKNGKMTDGIHEFLSSLGYDGIITDEEMVVFDPENIKSADPVTYDDNGNVILLSERFNTSNPDIRYSAGGEITDADIDQRLVEAGAIPQEEVEGYRGNPVALPLEGKNPLATNATGEAQRAFGEGMLQDSDQIARQAKAIVLAQNGRGIDTNAEQIDRAIDWVKSLKKTSNSDGLYEAIQQITSNQFDYRSADGQARMVAAMGMAAAKNDIMAQVALADAFNRQGTDLGRALQARKLFRLMTPQGRISAIEKLMQNTRDETGIQDLNFSEWVYRAAAAAEEEGDFEKVYNAAAEELAEQIPANWKDKLRGWRMLSMLGNPRTHVRNFIGNAMFIPMVVMKNKIGAAIEIATRVKQGERTKTLGLANKESRDFAKRYVNVVEADLRGDAKYDDRNAVKRAQKTWGTGKSLISRTLGKALQAVSDVNSNFLEWEDWVFLKGHFKRALAGYMTANHLTEEDMRNHDTLEKASKYAIQEAHKATYRDANSVATALSNFAKRAKGTKLQKGAEAVQFAVDAILPFKKTPANILRRGIEYSPVGFASALTDVKALVETVRHNNDPEHTPAPKREVTPSQFIDKIASGLTGTGVMILGAVLGAMGAANAGFDDDDPEDKLKRLEGEQEYGVNFGKILNNITSSIAGVELFGEDVTRTMDWAAPFSMPFFVGVALEKQLMKEHGDDQDALGAVLNSIMGITEPVFNLSMLDGVNSLFNVSQYDPMLPAAQIGMKVLLNYGSSYVPTLLGQVARTRDTTRRANFVKSGSKPYQLYSTIEQVQNKIPGLSELNIPYRNAYGEAEQNGSAMENFFAPWYKKTIKSDEITKEIRNVFDSLDKEQRNAYKGIVPSTPPRYFSVGGDTIRLEDKEYEKLQVVTGETGTGLLDQLMQTDEYKMSSPTTKAAMMEDIWAYANKKGKQSVADGVKLDSWMTKAENDGSVVNAVVERAIERNKEAYVEQRTIDLEDSLKNGDIDTVSALLTDLKDNMGIDEEMLRKPVSEYFRPLYYQAYLDQDDETMSDIKEIMMDFDIGYTKQTFSSWKTNAKKLQSGDEVEEEGPETNWLNSNN